MSWIATAQQITQDDRPKAYGHPLTNFLRDALQDNIQDAGRRREGDYITPLDVAIRRINGKMTREYNTHKDDNFVDTMGYSACVEAMDTRLKEMGYQDGVCYFYRLNLQGLFDLLLRSIEYDRLSAPPSEPDPAIVGSELLRFVATFRRLDGLKPEPS